ncbi:MAG TPA: acyltransferase family protein, partial [Candidatus Acidoferrales bacterium]|nr:acyltransferase family protein [Candidatus Acidoferrales bacterium]
VVPLLGLYLLAQWLWTGYNCMVSSSWPDLLALSGLLPGWGLWYLLSLATWRVTIPILKGIRSPVIFLVFAALAGAAAGHTNLGPILSLSRTVVFFPYFAAGFFARELNWQSLLGEQRRKIDFAVLALAIALLPCLLYFVHLSDRMILYFDSPLAAVPIRFSWGFLFRVLAYLFAFAVIRWLMLLIPKSQHKWTRIGEATLGIYLGHFYFLLILQHYIPKQDVGLMFLLSPFTTLALLWLLSRPAFLGRLNALHEGMQRLAMHLMCRKIEKG